jgi:hypothetical protein
MGTSTPFGGGSGNNPLIPSWLDGGGAPTPPSAAPSTLSDGSSSASDGGTSPSDGSNPSKPLSGPPADTGGLASPSSHRLRAPRKHFNQYARSGGSERASLGKAISSYVSRAGGSSTVARRMSSERAAAGRLGGVLNQAGQRGIREVLRTLNLDALANRSITEIYASLVDVICAPGGDLDEAFPRDAYLDAIAEVIETNPKDLEQPSSETIALIMERFIANTIRTRILNAIANQLVTLPSDVATVRAIDGAFREFVRGAVSDAMNEIGRVFHSTQIEQTINALYERSVAVLQIFARDLGESEGSA